MKRVACETMGVEVETNGAHEREALGERKQSNTKLIGSPWKRLMAGHVVSTAAASISNY